MHVSRWRENFNMEKFDGHDYTERSVLEELLLIERHAT